MRRLGSFSPLAVTLTLTAGCGVQPDVPSHLTTIMPSSAYSSGAVAVALGGGPFRPAIAVDTHSGAAGVGDTPFAISLNPVDATGNARPGGRAVSATDSQWQTSIEIDARIPPGLPAGEYAVAMIDPRGQAVPSTAVFTSLGPDIDAPVITFIQPAPNAAVGGGQVVSVIVDVNDGHGHVDAVTLTLVSPHAPDQPQTCVVGRDQPGDVTCMFGFIAPAADINLEPISVRIDAVDSVQNQSSATLPLLVAWRPTIAGVLPIAGSTVGGTEIVVSGQILVPGLSRILIDGLAIGGVVDGETIRGTTLPHIPGTGMVTVANGGSASGEVAFTFVPPPRVRIISPTEGPADASTPVDVAGNGFRDDTRFFWTQNGQQTPIDVSMTTVINENRAQIILPPGNGVVGIVAADPVSGDNELPRAFSYDAPIP